MEDFENYLIKKYPSLFYQNETKEPLCPCGICVPQGWEKIIDNLCGSIVDYAFLTSRQGQEILSKKYYFWHYLYLSLGKAHIWFIKLFPKLNSYELNKPFYNFLHTLSRKAHKHSRWTKIHTPEVKIDQVKEKFGDLRFYITGGDKQVEGMIHFAEYLCRKTCEVSGEDGVLCVRGNWYKTLSIKLLDQQPYQGYKPANNKYATF